MKSGAAYHRAYLHATQQAFFEAHEHAFAYFGGVFAVLRYDNLASAVTKVFRGHTRDEHTRFLAFRSHWHFDAEFCGPAQPQEKGGVEGEVGTFRRNHLVPVPEVLDLEVFNGKLLADCIADQSRQIGARTAPVGALLVRGQTPPAARRDAPGTRPEPSGSGPGTQALSGSGSRGGPVARAARSVAQQRHRFLNARNRVVTPPAGST